MEIYHRRKEQWYMEVCKTLPDIMYKKAIRKVRRICTKHSTGILTASMIITAMACAAGVSGGSRGLLVRAQSQETGMSSGVEENFDTQTEQTEELQAGLMGVVNSAITMEKYSRATQEVSMASENEEILVGAARASRHDVMRNALEEGTRTAASVGDFAKQLIRENQMPASEYNTLLRIVEAEATGEDLKGKMLIANVILNRVRDERFPDTIEEVVWQQIGGAAQFQPTIDGRIYSVEVTSDTIEAVDRVLAGEDYSQGALYFMARMASEDNSVGWFDNNLILLFEHGGHEYYTLSKEARVS